MSRKKALKENGVLVEEGVPAKVEIKSFVCPDALWEAFGLFAKQNGTNRSALLRGIMGKSLGLIKNNG